MHTSRLPRLGRLTRTTALPTKYRTYSALSANECPPSASPSSPLDDKFGIYVHWPYCESKCTYCSFNKYTQPKEPDHDRLRNALISELNHSLSERQLALSALNKDSKPVVRSVYFGGGTPSLALPTTLSAILETIKSRCNTVPDMEITLEANPTSTEVDGLRDFRDSGINRLSLGIQTFDSHALRILGREHTGSDAIRAIDIAKQVFPGRVTFDLIYGLPEQSCEGWKDQLKLGLELADNHISMYQLMIERGTSLHKDIILRGVIKKPDYEVVADMYQTAVDAAAEKGFGHYEVSNFARNRTSQGKHNSGYWKGADYIGIGPGAHGRITRADGHRERTYRILSPNAWMRQCETEGHGLRKVSQMTTKELREELIVLGMRTADGVSREAFKHFTRGEKLETALNMEFVNTCVSGNLLRWEYGTNEYLQEGGGLQPTEKGMAVMDSILPRIFTIE